MNDELDAAGIVSLFVQPEADGSFPRETADYFRALSAHRPAIVLAFAPKAAGTFLRTAAVAAVDGQLVRVVHAQGGRDAQPYLPTFVYYYHGGICTGTLVAHVHMQALAANQRFLEVFDLRPVIMIRPIADMLASYWDMLETEPSALQEGLNCLIPENFLNFPKERKAEFLVDILAPWYASYFATWLDYSCREQGRVCILTYDAFLRDPAKTLETILSHSRVPRPREICRKAVEAVWAVRSAHRFNRGETGRGRNYFAPHHIERIASMLEHYEIPDRDRRLLLATQ